jgi:cytochrome c-type biogenesis protein CcmH
MKTRSKVRLPVLLALLFGLPAGVGAQAPPSSQEALGRQIERELIAPCCWTQTVAEHRSEAAEKVRQEVREMVGKGMSHPQIVEAFVAKYGERIMAAPRPRGFYLTAYVLPGLGILFGVGIVALLLRRWRPSPAKPAPPPEPRDPAYLERVERELKESEGSTP